jgi:hypothetical protein
VVKFPTDFEGDRFRKYLLLSQERLRPRFWFCCFCCLDADFFEPVDPDPNLSFREALPQGIAGPSMAKTVELT